MLYHYLYGMLKGETLDPPKWVIFQNFGIMRYYKVFVQVGDKLSTAK